MVVVICSRPQGSPPSTELGPRGHPHPPRTHAGGALGHLQQVYAPLGGQWSGGEMLQLPCTSEPCVGTGGLQTLLSHLNPLDGASPGAPTLLWRRLRVRLVWPWAAKHRTRARQGGGLVGLEEGPGSVSGQWCGAARGPELGVLDEAPLTGAPGF